MSSRCGCSNTTCYYTCFSSSSSSSSSSCSSSSSDDCHRKRHHKKKHHKKHHKRDKCHKEKKCKTIVDEKFAITNLVSNLPVIASNQDANLINSWGIILVNNKLWVANNGSGLITTYNLNGLPTAPVVTVPPAVSGTGNPTGIVYNSGPNFIITKNTDSGPATVIVCTEDGTIAGYNQTVDSVNAITAVNRSGALAIYKGLAITSNNLYVADFHNNRIDTFDGTFNLLAGYPFIDPSLPTGYAPFNIVYLCNKLYVLYAKQDSAAEHNVTGPGNGFVSIFSLQGTFLGRLISGGYLNSPWGLAKTNCGALLIGNFGDGTIGIYNENGLFMGRLQDRNELDIIIGGLWGLIYGPIMYFSSGPNNKINGLVGSLALTC